MMGANVMVRNDDGDVLKGRQLGTSSCQQYNVRFEDDDSVATLKRADVYSYKECVMKFFTEPDEVICFQILL